MVRKDIQEEKAYLFGKFFIKNYTFSFYLYICAHACMGMGKFGHVNAMAHLWRPEDNLKERINSLLLPCGSWESNIIQGLTQSLIQFSTELPHQSSFTKIV